MAKLVVREGRNAGAEHLIPPEKARVVLGRSLDSSIQVLDAQASRTHAEITREGARFTLRDLKSSNGTRLNGRLVEGEAALKFGDKIGIGGTIYQFVPEADEVTGEGSGEEDAPAAPYALSPAEPEIEEKVFVADGELPRGFAEKKTAVVGRGEMEKGARSRATQSSSRQPDNGGRRPDRAAREEAADTQDAESVGAAERRRPPASSRPSQPGLPRRSSPADRPAAARGEADVEESAGQRASEPRPERETEREPEERSAPGRVGWWRGLPLWAKAVAVLGLAAAAVAFFAAAILVGLSSGR